MEQALGLATGQVVAVHERAVALGRGAGTGQEQAAAVSAGQQPLAAVGIGHGDRVAGIGIAVLGRTLHQQLFRLLRMLRLDPPGAGLAGLPPVLVQQRQIAAAPGDAGVARAQFGQLDRRGGERCGLHQHRIAHRRLARRITAILGFGPDQGGRRVGTPADRTHAGGHGVIAGGQAFDQGQAGHGVHGVAGGCVEHLDHPREAHQRHQEGERPLDPLRQHVAPVGRHRAGGVQGRRTDPAGGTADVDPRQLRGQVVLQGAGVVLVAQQVLVGAHRAHPGAGIGLLDVRPGRHCIGRRQRRRAGHLQVHQQAAAVGQPGPAAAGHGIEATQQPAGAACAHVHQPQLVAATGAVDAVERQPALVRRPRRAGQAQRLRQAGDADLLAVTDVHQPQVAAEGEGAGGVHARVDAQAGQLQLRLGDHLDPGQVRRLYQQGQVAARRQGQLRRARRIHDRLQFRHRLAVAVRLRHGLGQDGRCPGSGQGGAGQQRQGEPDRAAPETGTRERGSRRFGHGHVGFPRETSRLDSTRAGPVPRDESPGPPHRSQIHPSIQMHGYNALRRPRGAATLDLRPRRQAAPDGVLVIHGQARHGIPQRQRRPDQASHPRPTRSMQ